MQVDESQREHEPGPEGDRELAGEIRPDDRRQVWDETSAWCDRHAGLYQWDAGTRRLRARVACVTRPPLARASAAAGTQASPGRGSENIAAGLSRPVAAGGDRSGGRGAA